MLIEGGGLKFVLKEDKVNVGFSQVTPLQAGGFY